MTDETRIISYPHPADVDGEAVEVGPVVADTLQQATASYAEHVEAAVRQLRNSFQSRLLDDDASLTPEDLAREWEDSRAAKLAGLLVRSATGAHRAVQGLVDEF